jgi:soluble lytic murein transglycosylase
MLGKFSGNYAQATAAYNAGPGRPLQWAPQQLINADQWIESIPFTETREYVQAVMGYTTIYDEKLNPGKGRRLSERLQPIAPHAPTPAPTP